MLKLLSTVALCSCHAHVICMLELLFTVACLAVRSDESLKESPCVPESPHDSCSLSEMVRLYVVVMLDADVSVWD